MKKMTDDRDDGSRTASMLTKKGTRLENLIEAKAAALVTGCTKITPDPKGNYKSPTGVQMSIKSFNTLTSNDSEVGQYGCPYGVRVFLEFHRHVLYAFGGMLLLATWPALNNEWRRTQRIACRAQPARLRPSYGSARLARLVARKRDPRRRPLPRARCGRRRGRHRHSWHRAQVQPQRRQSAKALQSRPRTALCPAELHRPPRLNARAGQTDYSFCDA